MAETVTRLSPERRAFCERAVKSVKPIPHPRPPEAVFWVSPHYPFAAIDKRIPGCAAIRYDISSSETAENIAALADHPSGFGFADELRHAKQATRYPNGRPGSGSVTLVFFEKFQ